MSRFILALSIGGLLWMPVMASAQAPTAAAPSASAPGKSSLKVDMVPSLFVMNARGASLTGVMPAANGLAVSQLSIELVGQFPGGSQVNGGFIPKDLFGGQKR